MNRQKINKDHLVPKNCELAEDQLDDVVGGVNDTNTDVDRSPIQKEIEDSMQQINEQALRLSGSHSVPYTPEGESNTYANP